MSNPNLHEENCSLFNVSYLSLFLLHAMFIHDSEYDIYDNLHSHSLEVHILPYQMITVSGHYDIVWFSLHMPLAGINNDGCHIA